MFNAPLASSLLSYEILSQPFIISPEASVFTIKVSAKKQSIFLSSIEITLPIETHTSPLEQNLVDNMPLLKGTSGIGNISIDGIDLLQNGEESKTADFHYNYRKAGNVITIQSANNCPLLINKDASFILKIQLSNVSELVGVSQIALNENAGTTATAIQSRRSFISLNKLPALVDFKADKNEAYYNEPVKVRWKMALNDESRVLLNLLSSDDSENNGIDVTDSAISEGQYEYVVHPKNLTEDTSYSLQIILLDEHNQAEVVYDFPTTLSLKALPPVITMFTADSLSRIPSEVNQFKVDSEVTLSWQAQGKVDYYYLDIDGEASKRLSPDTTFYPHKPTTSTTYRLTGYIQGYSQPLTEKKLSVVLCQPKYKPELLTSSDKLVAAQISPDGTTLYIANETSVKVMDTSKKEVKATIPVPNGVNAIILSSDASILYIVDKSPSILTLLTASNTLMAPINIDKMPRVLISHGNELFVASQHVITVINRLNNQRRDFNFLRANGFISALAFHEKTRTLFVANTSSNAITVLDVPVDGKKAITQLEFSLLAATEHGLALPRSLMLTSDNKLFVALAGNDSVISFDISNTHSTRQVIDFSNAPLNNPESLFVVDVDKVQQLCVTSGLTNTVSVLNLHTHEELSLPVGLNPRSLIATQNGEKVYTVCSDGIYAFFTKEQIIPKAAKSKKERPVVIPAEAEKKKDLIPGSSLETDAIDKELKDATSANRKRSQELATSPFGLFYPDVCDPDRAQKEAESLQPFGLYFPKSAVGDAAKQAVAVAATANTPIDADNIATTQSSQPVDPKATAVSTGLSLFGSSSKKKQPSSADKPVLQDAVSPSGKFSSSEATLEEQADGRFVLNIFQQKGLSKYRDSDFNARVARISSTLQQQMSILEGIKTPIVINLDSAKSYIIEPNRIEQADALKTALIKMTGLNCVTTAQSVNVNSKTI